MTDPTEKPEIDATGTEIAGAEIPRDAKASKRPKADKALQEAMEKISPPPTIVVTGPEKGRWRIGRKFTREPVSIAVGELTEAECLALKADPELHIQVIDAPH